MGLKKIIYLPILLVILSSFAILTEKEYVKKYFENGSLSAEGWQIENSKSGYWIHYFQNGEIAKKGSYQKNKKHGYWYFYSEEKKCIKEGHFDRGNANNWWTFYDNNQTRKVQLKNNQKEGFALIYEGKMLKKVEKYAKDKKIGEWTSLFDFRKDNPEVQF